MLDVRLEDFTLAAPHQIKRSSTCWSATRPMCDITTSASEEKRRLKARTREACGIKVNGLAGLYCYFLGLSHQWMAEGGLGGWLIPSEFMAVNYGASVKRYLLDKVTLLHIHRFDPKEVQFGDALVSSAVVWFSKQEPPDHHKVRMTYGGSLLRPSLERLVPVDTLRRDPEMDAVPGEREPLGVAHAGARGLLHDQARAGDWR